MLLIRNPFTLLLPMAVVALGVVGLWQLCGKPRGQLESTDPVGELLQGGRVGQSLVMKGQGLYRIDVRLATYARENHGPVIFRLKSSPSDATDLVTLTFEAADVRDNTFHAFRFRPLSLPVGAPLYFGLEGPGATPGNALTIWGTQVDSFSEGEAVFTDLPNPNEVKDLAFKLYYLPDLPRTIAQLSGRLTAGKPVPFERPWLYAGSGLLYLYLLFRLGSAFASSYGSDHPIPPGQPKL